MIAKEFDGSINRRDPGRPRTEAALEALIVRWAKENQSWDYDCIVGALANIGYTISSQTVGNILKKHGLVLATDRKKTISWKDFIRRHKDQLVATDFFTTEVWTFYGLVTYYILFFIRINTWEVHVAGLTPHPNQSWMTQIARKVTVVDLGFLMDGEYLSMTGMANIALSFRRP